MTRSDFPRRHLAVMTILILSLGLALAAWTLLAEPEDDAEGPRAEAVPNRLRISLGEANRLEETGMDPMRPGETRVVELDRPWAAAPGSAPPTCLARPFGSGPDPCRAGEAIGRMPACREPGDCPAYEAWTRLFGMLRPELALPDPDATRPPTHAPEDRK